jgi:hypothetical protein
VNTPDVRFAAIVGAAIPVVAVAGSTAHANAVETAITEGAEVAIVTCAAAVCWNLRTRPSSGVAEGGQAGCIETLRGGAVDWRLRGHFAGVWQFLQIAVKGAVAQVPIFQAGAILIALAIAGNGGPRADSRVTFISNCTGVQVIAICHIRLELAAAQPITGVVSTGIAVVTIDGGTQTLARFAVVAHRTGVPVNALPFVQRFVDAATLPRARVVSTGVAVVASRFVDGTVAIVVETVADIGFGWGGIAVGETVFRANPLPLAGAEFVGEFTPGPERQRHRRRGTWADPCGRSTLPGLDAINGQTIGTGEAEGAILVFGATAAAEASLFTVIHAHIFGSHRALTIAPHIAGTAEVGHVGNAHEDQIGSGAGHLMARPTGRALVLTS